MRKVEPAFPDLLPVTHRIGGPPAKSFGFALDPVDMRLRWGSSSPSSPRRRGTRPSRPVRALAHAATVAAESAWLEELLDAGNGLLVVLDEDTPPASLPQPRLAGQIVVMAPRLPRAWGGGSVRDLRPFVERGLEVGVLLALAPLPRGLEEVQRSVRESIGAGARFVAAAPLAVPPADRHRLYDLLAGDEGDEELENLLFHTDFAPLLEGLEREASRCCVAGGVEEFIPPPATSIFPQQAARPIRQMLLWARRLDLLDGLASPGWQLRRAASALQASGKDPLLLAAEDNLRIVPGFDPWVEAFARSLWQGGGEPFDGVRERWLAW